MISCTEDNGLRIYEYNDDSLLAYTTNTEYVHVLFPMTDGTLRSSLKCRDPTPLKYYANIRRYCLTINQDDGYLSFQRMEVSEVLDKSIGLAKKRLRLHKRLLEISRSVPPEPITFHVGEHTIISHPGEYAYHDVLISPNGERTNLRYNCFNAQDKIDFMVCGEFIVGNNCIIKGNEGLRFFGRIEEEEILSDIRKMEDRIEALKEIRYIECDAVVLK